jgi:hypothetical protein
MCTSQSKRGRVVIERCPCPGNRSVTGRTLLREPGLGMVWVRRSAVIGEMTGNAGCRKAGIDIVLVTCGALHTRMGAGQRKLCRAVIKSGSQKSCCGMAKGTVLREPGLGVIRILRPAVICEVTGNAGCRKTGIDIVLVTCRALHTRMGARQRERRCIVIKSGSQKSCCGMAKGAVLREPGLGVIRIPRPAVIGEVTRNASFRKTGVDVVFVTCGALHARMGAGQRELCRAVIERRSRPGSRIVAGRTLL